MKHQSLHLSALMALVLGGLFAGCQTESTTEPQSELPQATAAQEPAQSEPAPADTVALPAINGVQAEAGLVFAGQPTEEELRAFAAAGYRVLDLRTEGEERGFAEAAVAEELGMQYQNLPVSRESLAVPAVHAAFREALLADRAEAGPLLVHCASSNRVGGLYYAHLVETQGLDRAAALERAKELGLTSPGVLEGIEAFLDRPSD